MTTTHELERPIMEIKGAPCLVIGGARKLGKEIALDLAAHGAQVAISYRTPGPAVDETCAAIEALSGGAFATAGDLTEPEDTRRMVAEAAAALGGLSVVVYAASGPFSPQRPEEIDATQWEASIGAIAGGFFFSAQAAFAQFRDARRDDRGEAGVIVAITDTLGVRPPAAFAAHAAAKAAQIALVRSLAKAWAADGVRVCGVAPGPLDVAGDARRAATERAAQRTALKRLIQPREIAHAVRFCIENQGLTGENFAVDGGQLIV
jgi:NAD(P)-dependent dehydrogenase (short-subunit alcohol dehydrogenase family)